MRHAFCSGQLYDTTESPLISTRYRERLEKEILISIRYLRHYCNNLFKTYVHLVIETLSDEGIKCKRYDHMKYYGRVKLVGINFQKSSSWHCGHFVGLKIFGKTDG